MISPTVIYVKPYIPPSPDDYALGILLLNIALYSIVLHSIFF